MRTNFIRETGTDTALLALAEAQRPGFVDLLYNGVPARAYVQPLLTPVPWSLVVFRGHELEDNLVILTITRAAVFIASMSFAYFLVVWFSIWFAQRHVAKARRLDWLPSLLEARTPLTILALATAAIYIGLYIWGPSKLPHASMMVLALCSPAIALLIIWRHVGRWNWISDQPKSFNSSSMIILLAALFLNFSVIPAAGMFQFHRNDLSTGFRSYLADTARDDVNKKYQRHKQYLRRYVDSTPTNVEQRLDDVFATDWPILESEHPCNSNKLTNDRGNGVAKSTLTRDCRDSRLKSINDSLKIKTVQHDELSDSSFRWGEAAMRMADFSTLASDVAARTMRSDPTSAGLRPGRAYERIVGGDKLSLFDVFAAASGMTWLYGIGTLAFGAAIGWIALLSLGNRVLGGNLRIALLPAARTDRAPHSWQNSDNGALRGCLIHQSETLTRDLVKQLCSQRYTEAKFARWSNNKLSWETFDLQNAEVERLAGEEKNSKNADDTLYLILNLERFLLDNRGRDALLRGLERLTAERKSYLMGSRVLPSYWLARLNRSQRESKANADSTQGEEHRWSTVLAPLDVRRLGESRAAIRKRFDQSLGVAQPNPQSSGPVYATMLQEAYANPQLLKLAVSITKHIHAKTSYSPAGAQEVALHRFSTSAAAYFQNQWSFSTYEERLQLYALAIGGFANPTRTIVLSSLANRGLITAGGFVAMRSSALGQFIANDLEHDELHAWRKETTSNTWRSIWPPIAAIVVLALAFFIRSTPEAIAPLTAILAATLGVFPVVATLLRGFSDVRPRQSDS